MEWDNHLLTDKEKSDILHYLFSSIALSHYKYDLLKSKKQLEVLLTQKYYVSANFYGYNCLLIFTKINDKYYSVMIDRKTLSFNISKIDYTKVKILNVNLKLDVSIYSGTILDGIFFYGSSGNKTFIITDVYKFRGQDFSSSRINIKLITILSYLENIYDQNDKENDIILITNKLYELDKLEHLVKKVIPSNQHDKIHGICFYPEISATKLIFTFSKNPQKNKAVDKEYNDNKIYLKQQYKPRSGVEYVFALIKTDKVDVYELNIAEKISDDKLKRINMGIAYVPTTARSVWCNEIFKNTDKKSINVVCKYHRDKMKWEPIEVSDEKYPSLTTEFD